MVEVHAQRTRWPIDNQFRMLLPKGLSDMAAPADGPMCPQRFLQVFGWDLVPLHGLLFFAEQSWRVVMPVDLSEWFVANTRTPGLGTSDS